METSPIRVVWASEATGSQQVSLCPKTGANQVFKFARPDVPGLITDLEVAIKILDLRILQTQQQMLASSIANQRSEQLSAALSNLAKSLFPTPPPTVICNSTVLGSTIRTVCR